MSPEANEQRIRQTVLTKLPALSPVILRVLDELAKDDGELAKLAREITADANLSAQLLRLANSALFGLSSKVDTVQRAVCAVGISWVQHLTVSVAAGSYMKAASQTKELQRCWRHTLATAVLSRELAKAAGMAAERAYTVGLLHDIGCLGLMAAFPREYAKAMEAAHGDSTALLEEEKQRFAADHCEIGRWLLTDWRLPEEFCRVVGQHHEKPRGDGFDLSTAVQLACGLADTLGYSMMEPAGGMAWDDVLQLLPERARARLADDPAVLVERIEQVIGGKGLQWTAPTRPAPPVVEFPAPAQPPRSIPLGLILAGITAAVWLAISVRW